MLLDNKSIDVNLARSNNGATPLFAASKEGHIEVVKLLLDKVSIPFCQFCTQEPWRDSSSFKMKLSGCPVSGNDLSVRELLLWCWMLMTLGTKQT